MVDIKFIARVSGVSISTVSRVLNHSKPVSPALQAKVMRAVEKYNYRPNTIAQQMISKRTRLIGVILTNIANPFQAAQLAYMEEYALTLGYHIIVVSTYGQLSKFRQALSIMRERCVDTIIAMIYFTENEKKEIAANLNIPIIYPNMTLRDSAGKPVLITVDEFQGSYDITEYLLKNGHKRLGCFCYSNGPDHRKSGFLSALRKHQIPIVSKYLICGPNDETILEKAKALLGEPDYPSAWFCAHDMLAMRFMIFLAKHHIRVPEDISLVGFDDIPFAAEIGLTTIRQPVKEKARRQIDIARALAEHRYFDGYEEPVPYQLIERSSVQTLNFSAQTQPDIQK